MKYETVGERIKRFRKDKKMTQEELAKKVGIGRVSLTRIETNRQEAKGFLLMRIADALETTTDALLKGKTPFTQDIQRVRPAFAKITLTTGKMIFVPEYERVAATIAEAEKNGCQFIFTDVAVIRVKAIDSIEKESTDGRERNDGRADEEMVQNQEN